MTEVGFERRTGGLGRESAAGDSRIPAWRPPQDWQAPKQSELADSSRFWRLPVFAERWVAYFGRLESEACWDQHWFRRWYSPGAGPVAHWKGVK